MRLVVPFLFLIGCPTGEKNGPEADLDADDDGLLDDEEATYGTDPTLADSDGDGFGDKDEVDAGYSPTWEFSHPYEEGDYLIGNCPVHPDVESAGPTGTGSYKSYTWDAYQDGDVMANLLTHDKYDQDISLYAFCGNYVLVTESAEWCGPCQEMASTMAEEMAVVRESYPNFTFYEYLYQNNRGGDPSANVLENWEEDFNLSGEDDVVGDQIPVVAPEDNTADETSWLSGAGYIPATTLVAPDGTVVWSVVSHPRETYLWGSDAIIEAIADYEE